MIKIFQKSLKKEIAKLSNKILNSVWLNKMNLEPIKLITNEKGTDFLFGCKNLYLASIHPFDLEKSNLPAYKQLIALGKDLLEQRGLDRFVDFLMEHQYRVAVWASMIALEYGKPKPKEMFSTNPNKSIIDACLECIMQDEIEPLSVEITENKKKWTQKNLPQSSKQP